MKTLFILVAAVMLVACNKSKSGTVTGGGAPAVAAEVPPSTVVATYEGGQITAGELDQKAGAQLTEAKEQYEKQRHDIRRQTLDQMVMESLLNAEAKKRGLANADALLKTEVDDKVPAPPDDQVQKVYEESKGRLPPGSSLEQFKPQIVDFLTRTQRQEKARALFDDLRKKNNVVAKLQEPVKQRKQVEAKGPSRGPDNAPITLIEFSDFECPFCGRGRDTVENVMQAYGGKVKLVFRHFPLDFHANAVKAAEASMCAHDQGKFWEYHDLLFKNREKLAVPQLKEHAAAVGLDAQKFTQCLDSGKHNKLVQEDLEAGKKLGVNDTPAFFVNGIMISGAVPFDEFKKVIDAELATGTN